MSGTTEHEDEPQPPMGEPEPHPVTPMVEDSPEDFDPGPDDEMIDKPEKEEGE
jgi:hypothetical protein